MRLKCLLKILFIPLSFFGVTVLADARHNSDLKLFVSQVEEFLIGESLGEEYFLLEASELGTANSFVDIYMEEALNAAPSFGMEMQTKKRVPPKRKPTARPRTSSKSTKRTTKTTSRPAPAPIVAVEETKKKGGLPIIGIKTDFLRWGGLLSNMYSTQTITYNLGLDLYFGKSMSLSVDGSYSNGAPPEKSVDLYHAYSQVSLEGRYWLSLKKKDPFLTPYFGVYGVYGEFNVQNKVANGIGDQGSFMGGGISFGCGLPISNSWVVDVGVRGGYKQIMSQRYKVQGGIPLKTDKTPGNFVLEGISMSLVYRFISKKPKASPAPVVRPVARTQTRTTTSTSNTRSSRPKAVQKSRPKPSKARR